jgi:hypothetical protein
MTDWTWLYLWGVLWFLWSALNDEMDDAPWRTRNRAITFGLFSLLWPIILPPALLYRLYRRIQQRHP